MKLNTSGFLIKCQFPLIIALATAPLMTLVILSNAPSELPALTVLIPAYVLLTWLCMLLPGKIRIAAGALSCALLMLLGLRLLPSGPVVSAVDAYTLSLDQRVFLLIIPFLLCAELLYSLRFAAWPRDREIAFNWYAIGLGIHLLVQLISYVQRRVGSAAWECANPWLLLAFIAFMLLVLLSMNRVTMGGASLGRQRVPLSMRRKNTALTVSLLAASLIIAAIPSIARLIESLWHAFIRAVGAVMAFIAGLLAQDEAGAGGGVGGSSMFPPVMSGEEPSLLAKLLEWIATLLVLAALIALAIFFMRFLVQKLTELLRLLYARLRQYMSSASQDYVDEITDTREDGSQTQGTLLARLRRRMTFVNEKRLTPAERIRYRYRQLLKRHPDWHNSRTARENLPEDTASLYELARYSGRELNPQDAERFTGETRHT